MERREGERERKRERETDCNNKVINNIKTKLLVQLFLKHIPAAYYSLHVIGQRTPLWLSGTLTGIDKKNTLEVINNIKTKLLVQI